MKSIKLSIFFWISILFSLSLGSCNVTTNETPRYIPDTKGMEETVTIERFEQDLFALDTNQIETGLTALKNKYPAFALPFLQTVLRVPSLEAEPSVVKGYLGYAPARETYQKVQEEFKTMPLVQEQLNSLATHFAYYKLNTNVPITTAYTHLCEYSYDRAIGDGYVPLPLDMALGQGYPAYTLAKIPLYQQRTLNREHLVAKAAYAIAEDVVTSMTQTKSSFMIDYMLQEGKKFYITDILLPQVADSIKFSFSSQQMSYCQRGELELYEHLNDQELLYSDKSKLFSKYITAGPFNPALSLPGNSGTWLGYRMVLAYANQQRKLLQKTNPKLSAREIDQQVLQQIITENDPQQYLQTYKPQK